MPCMALSSRSDFLTVDRLKAALLLAGFDNVVEEWATSELRISVEDDTRVDEFREIVLWFDGRAADC